MDAESSSTSDNSRPCSQSNILTLLEELGNDTIKYGSKISLSKTDFKCLTSPHRITSSITDAYLSLISNRSQEKGFPTVHCFDTAFGISLLESGPRELTLLNMRYLDLYSYNFLLVPFWCINYWMMFLVDNITRKILFYDIGSTSRLAIDCLQDFLKSYHTMYIENYKNKGSMKFNSPFKHYKVVDEGAKCLNIPAAASFSDADVLVLVFAELITKSSTTTSNDKNIDCESYRRKIIYELLTSKLLPEETTDEPELLVEIPVTEKSRENIPEQSELNDAELKMPDDVPELPQGVPLLKKLLSEKLTLLDVLCDRSDQFWEKRPPDWLPQ